MPTGERPCTHNELFARVVALEAGLVALREMLDERDKRYALRASAQDAAVKTAMDASDKALVKAESGTERRLEALNELRSMASDQANKLLPRAEYDAKHEALTDRVQSVEANIASMLARGGGLKDAWVWLIAIVGIAATALVGYLRH